MRPPLYDDDTARSLTADRLFGGNGRTYQPLPTRQETKAAPDFVPFGQGVIEILSGTSPDADRLTRSIAYATSAYAFVAIDYRAARLSEPPLVIMRETDDGEEREPDHELADVLREPTPDFDMGELLYLTESYRLITGQALWVLDRDRLGRVGRITPFDGDSFTTEAANGLIFGRYWVQTATGRKQFKPEDVVHFRDPDPRSWRDGVSRLDVALSHLDLGHQILRMIRNYAKRALFPGGLISPDPTWNPAPDEWKQYREAIEAFFGGPINAGSPMVLRGGTKFSATASSMKDMLPTEILNRIEATVGSVFGVPPVVLGWQVGLENSPWSQMGEARRSVYEETIEPRWRDNEKRLSRKLLPPEERERGYVIRFDTSNVRALFDDDAQLAAVAAQMRREWTLDERRLYTGKPKLDDGDPRGGAIEGQTPDAGAPYAPTALTGLRPSDTKAADKTLRWALFDGMCKAAESTWERQIAKTLDAQRAAIVRLVRKHIRSEKAIDPLTAALFADELDRWIEEIGRPQLRSTVYPLVLTTAEKAVREAAAMVGQSFTVFEPALAGYADRTAEQLAEWMSETTHKEVVAAVQKGLEEGDLVRDLVKRVEQHPAFDRARAKLVARTETTRAWNGAQRTSMSQYEKTSGNLVEKSWLSSRDGRVREEHDELDDGKWYAIDHVFANGLTEPGEPNCRCTLLYRIRDPMTAEGKA